MTDKNEIAWIIEKALTAAGYTCDTNDGTIWVDVGDGETYSMTVEKCVNDDDVEK